jgi:hypothetical protein
MGTKLLPTLFSLSAMKFSPLILDHAATLLDVAPPELLRDPKLLLNAQEQAQRHYDLTEFTVGALTGCLEAGALGSRLFAEDGELLAQDRGDGWMAPPPLCSELEEILDLEPYDPQSDGFFSDILEIARGLKIRFPDIPVYMPVCGPFCVAARLLGDEGFLCEFLEDEELAMQALEHLLEPQIALCEEITMAGVGVRILEPGASPPVLEPGQFRDVAVPVLHQLVRKARGSGDLPVILQLDGNLAMIGDGLAEIAPEIITIPAATEVPRFLRKLRENGFHGKEARLEIPGKLFLPGNRRRLEKWFEKARPILAEAETNHLSLNLTTSPLPLESDPAAVLHATALAEPL